MSARGFGLQANGPDGGPALRAVLRWFGDRRDNVAERHCGDSGARTLTHPEAIQCGHQDSQTTSLACVHLIASNETFRRYHRRFSGVGKAFDAMCPECHALLPAAPPL